MVVLLSVQFAQQFQKWQVGRALREDEEKRLKKHSCPNRGKMHVTRQLISSRPPASERKGLSQRRRDAAVLSDPPEMPAYEPHEQPWKEYHVPGKDPDQSDVTRLFGPKEKIGDRMPGPFDRLNEVVRYGPCPERPVIPYEEIPREVIQQGEHE